MCDCESGTQSDSSKSRATDELNPQINRFLLYAERSLTLGQYAHTEGGDLGVRTALPQQDPAQMILEKHAKGRDLFAPSVQLDIYAEVEHIWTNQLDAVEDVGKRGQSSFPSNMPPLPLASASGQGPSITVGRNVERSLAPGCYGDLTLLYRSQIWLSEGEYTFASIRMDEESKFLADPGGVKVGIVGRLWMDRFAVIAPQGRCPEAAHFTISIAGRDIVEDGNDGNERSSGSYPAAVIGEEAHVHALLAAPHGTLIIGERAKLKGAFAGFDIVVHENACAEFQNGFPNSPPGQQGSQVLSGYYGQNPNPLVAPLIGPAPADAPIGLALSLPVQDQAGLTAFIQDISDPHSPNFRKGMTQAQFYATHGAPDADYQAVKDWATSNGLTVLDTYASNLLVTVYGTVAQVEQALFVNIVYRKRLQDGQFFAVDREPSLNLSPSLLEIGGLKDFILPQPAAIATGNGNTFLSADLRNAYLGAGSPLLTLTGAGQNIGLFELASFQQSDVVAYAANQDPTGSFPGNPSLNANLVQLATIEAPPWFSGYSLSNEVALDIDVAMAMAPGANIFVFQGTVGITSDGQSTLHAMANWSPPLTTASCSWTFGRSGSSQQALDQMAAQSVSFFTASGDFGDIGDPQSNIDLLNQTLVGGTILSTATLGSPPAIYPSPYYLGETTWNQNPASQGKGITSGGIMDGNNAIGGDILGISSPGCYCWPYPACCGSGVSIPPWQVGMMESALPTNGASPKWRNYPDVAMIAQSVAVFYNGAWIPGGVGGTSAAAPCWAAFVALVNEQIKKNDPSAGLVGFINPVLYDMAITSGLSLDLYAQCFNDIQDNVSNANGFGPGHNAGVGYDLCTGLGSPKPAMLLQLSSPTPLHPVLEAIRIVIGTGNDNLRGNGGFASGCGGTGCTVDFLFPGFNLSTGDAVMTKVLKQTGGDDEWGNWSTTQPFDFAIDKDNNGNPLPIPTGPGFLAGFRISIQQDYSSPCGPDNWDVTSVAIDAFMPTHFATTAACQFNLAGTAPLQDGHPGLVRLSNSAGSSGVGLSATFMASDGTGC